MTMQPTVQQTLTLANLQMATEATLVDADRKPVGGADLIKALTEGNNRASRFTEPQAKEFVENWAVVEQNNTTTGFSGTLFRNRQTGELVMRLRSTEFVDDAARDNKATNELEISKHGFAFGQLRDLEAWYDKLTQPGGELEGRAFGVTGYSLGGHLASALNLMHGGERLADGTQQLQRVVQQPIELEACA